MVFKKIVALDSPRVVRRDIPPLTSERFLSVFHVLSQHNLRAREGVYPSWKSLYSDFFLYQRPASPAASKRAHRKKQQNDRSLSAYVEKDISVLLQYLRNPFGTNIDSYLVSATKPGLTIKQAAELRKSLFPLDPFLVKLFAMACLSTRNDSNHYRNGPVFEFFVPPHYALELCRMTESDSVAYSDIKRQIDQDFSTMLFSAFFSTGSNVIDLTFTSYFPISNNVAYVVLKLAEGLPFGCESHVFFGGYELNIPPQEFLDRGVYPFALEDSFGKPLKGFMGLMKRVSQWGNYVGLTMSDSASSFSGIELGKDTPGVLALTDSSKEDADAHYFLPSGLVELDKQ